MAELGKAYVSIIPKMQGNIGGVMSKEMDAAGAKSGKLFGAKFSATAKKAVAAGAVAVAAAGAAATAKVLDLASSTAEYGDHVDKMSQKMGISSKSFQEWDAVLQHSGTSMDAMTPAFKKLATQAQGGGDKTEAAFKKIGISMKDAQSMSTEELWSATIKGLQGMEEGTERTAVASQLLGRGATELGALLNTSAEDTQKMVDTVNELGGVMDEEGIKNAAAFQDALQDMQTALAAIGRAIGANVMPTLTLFMDGFTNFLTGDPVVGLKQMKEAFVGLFPEGMQETLKNIINTVGEKLAPAFDDAKGIVDDLSEKFDTFMQENGPALTDMFGTVAETVSSVMGIVREVIGAVMPVVGRVVSTAVRTITGAFKGLSVVTGIVRRVFNAVKSAIADPIGTAKRLVSEGIGKIKSIIDGLHIKLPEIKLPHFSVTGGEAPYGLGGKGSLPHFSIDWYAKGGIFDGASLIGVGERGAEAVVPLTSDRMKPFARAIAEAGGSGSVVINLAYDASADAAQMANELAREVKRALRRG